MCMLVFVFSWERLGMPMSMDKTLDKAVTGAYVALALSIVSTLLAVSSLILILAG